MQRLSPGGDERGMALLLTLWMLTALAAMAVPLALDARAHGERSMRLAEILRMRAAADGALAIVAAAIEQGRAGAGTLARYRIGEAEVEVRVSGESGRVDLNRAPESLLDAVLRAHGFRDAERRRLRREILAWRRGEDAALLAAAAAFPEATSAAAPRRPFRHPADLRLLPGFADTRYEELAADLTVWTGADRIEPDLAAPRLRREIGAPERRPGEAAAEGGRRFMADPNGIYRVELLVRTDGGAVRRSRAVLMVGEEGGADDRLLDWLEPLALDPPPAGRA